jgi:hypothetical protein
MSRVVVLLSAIGIAAGVGSDAAAFGGPGPGGRPPAFSDLDANKDGEVTAAEFDVHAQQRAREHFKQMDGNGDGVLTEEEFRARRPHGRGPGPGRGGPGSGPPPP